MIGGEKYMKKLLKGIVESFKMFFGKQEKSRYFVLEEIKADGTFTYWVCYGTKYYHNVVGIDYNKHAAIKLAEKLNGHVTVKTNIIDV